MTPAGRVKRAARAPRGFHTFEKRLHEQGFTRVAGVDEAGRGPLAGPVCAAVAVFRPGARIRGVNDSKQLTEKKREWLFDEIMDKARGVGVGLVWPDEIDALNILRATHLAVRRALEGLPEPPDHLLLDALRLADVPLPQESLVKGDARCFCIAAASIVAKVTRDRLMLRYEEEYPQYGLARHKGYGTEHHRRALACHGMSTIHRRTFCDFGLFGPLPFDPDCVAMGWTDEVRVRSVSFERIRLAAAGARTQDAVAALEAEVAALTGFLPAVETDHLRAMLADARKRTGPTGP